MEITQLLQTHRIPYKVPGSRGELWLCCPFCVERNEPTPDTNFRLGLNFERDQGHCFRCDWRSSTKAVKAVLEALLGQTVEERVQGPEGKEEKADPIELPEDFQLLVDLDEEEDELAYEAYTYMRDRGVSRGMMHRKGLGVSLSGQYQYRVIFPVYWRGRLRAIVARDFTKTSRIKYLNSKGVKYLYNMPERTDRVVLAEGALKALAIEKSIGQPAAALLGHNLTPRMLKQLVRAQCKEIVVWPDPDAVGVKGAVEVASQLMEDFKRVSFIFPLPKKQADEMSSEKIVAAFESRVRFDWSLENKISARVAFRS